MAESSQPRLAFPSSPRQRPNSSDDTLTQEESGQSKSKMTWWKIKLFEGMTNDIKRRSPYYWSDWKDAWDYRVVPATVYMYFAKQVSMLLVQTRLVLSCCLPLDSFQIVECKSKEHDRPYPRAFLQYCPGASIRLA